jgi:response regulator NasT
MGTRQPDSVPTTFGPCRALVADDEHLIAIGIASNLRDLGHEVVGIASDGEAAFALAREQSPELALLDLRMPKLSGAEAAMILYEELGVPSIIVSAYSDQEHVARIQGYGSSSGVYGYLLKPVGVDELRVSLGVARQRAAVDQHRADRISQLENNLANRRTVEQAKWKLVERLKITEPVAHDRLQRVARDRRRPLIEIARRVIENDDMLEDHR